MRFIICIKDFGLFKCDKQYATPHCNLGPGVRQFSYQIYGRKNYDFICSVNDREFKKHFVYYGEYQSEMQWCDELFNILMDGKGDMYNIVY